jgi:hypothetical protein
MCGVSVFIASSEVIVSVTGSLQNSLSKTKPVNVAIKSERKITMSELEKQITNRVANNADLEGAQDLIDAHIDAVTGGYFLSFLSFESDAPRPISHLQ